MKDLNKNYIYTNLWNILIYIIIKQEFLKMKDNVFIVNIKGFFFPPSICDNENLGNFLKNKIKLFMEHLFRNKICGGIWCNAFGLFLKGTFVMTNFSRKVKS